MEKVRRTQLHTYTDRHARGDRREAKETDKDRQGDRRKKLETETQQLVERNAKRERH